uniref:Uncharacterized protein n=1 Tax=Ditylenchus dipsaci TaxID=166011 RepID=A0A915CLG9_9BILA
MLTECLWKLGLFPVGTVRKNRGGLPTDFVKQIKFSSLKTCQLNKLILKFLASSTSSQYFRNPSSIVQIHACLPVGLTVCESSYICPMTKWRNVAFTSESSVLGCQADECTSHASAIPNWTTSSTSTLHCSLQTNYLV